MIVALPFISLLLLLILGIPIAFSLAGAGILGIWLVKGDWGIVMVFLRTVPVNAVANYDLTTIPMFLLMAYFSSSSGLAKDLYTAASNWLSQIRGGLAIATVFACGIFGAMSGASVAAAAVMSNIAMPNMRRYGYSEELAAGSVGVGATLDILIPPSVPMVIYGIATQTSIGQLLVAGVVPGIVLGILLALCIVVWVTISPSHAPKTERVSWKERFASTGRIWPSLLLIAIVLALLYSGVATPTEVGAVGSFMAAGIGVAMGRLSLGGGHRGPERDDQDVRNDLPDPDRGKYLRLLHDTEPDPAGGRRTRNGNASQPLDYRDRHYGCLLRHQHVHG